MIQSCPCGAADFDCSSCWPTYAATRHVTSKQFNGVFVPELSGAPVDLRLLDSWGVSETSY